MDAAETIKNSQRKWVITAVVCGVVIVLSTLSGLIGTVIGMTQAFNELEKTGRADPADLAGSISIALLTTLWGLVFALPALVVFAVAVIKLLVKRRQTKRLGAVGANKSYPQ